MILKMSPSFALIACCPLLGIPPEAFAEDTPEIKEGILRKEVKAQVLERKRTVTVRIILEHFAHSPGLPEMEAKRDPKFPRSGIPKEGEHQCQIL